MDTSNIIRDSFSQQVLRAAVYHGIENLYQAFAVVHRHEVNCPDGSLPDYWCHGFSGIVDSINRLAQHKEFVRVCSLKLLRERKISKEPCKSCGEDDVEIHHHDYDAHPSNITWLCRSCHVDEHIRLEAEKPAPVVECTGYEIKLLKLAISIKEFRAANIIYLGCLRENEDSAINSKAESEASYQKWLAEKEKESASGWPDEFKSTKKSSQDIPV